MGVGKMLKQCLGMQPRKRRPHPDDELSDDEPHAATGTNPASEATTKQTMDIVRPHTSSSAISKAASVTPETLDEVYCVLEKLGEGTFATVYKVKSRKSGKPYACKTIQKSKLKGNFNQLSSELDILLKVSHPAVVSLAQGEKSVFNTTKSVHLVTDLCEGGELFDAIVARGSYTERDAMEVVAMVLNGLAYLHENGIVHRDLKPENLLLKDDTELSQIKITDFGLSKILDHASQMLMTRCGTPAYVAPEVLTGSGHSFPCDMWSLGCITYVLLSGYTPFWGDDQQALLRAIMDVDYEFEEEYWAHVSEEAKDFIRSCLKRAPADRITAADAQGHAWLKKTDEGVDLLAQVQENFSARKTWHKAVGKIKAMHRLIREGSPEPGMPRGAFIPAVDPAKERGFQGIDESVLERIKEEQREKGYLLVVDPKDGEIKASPKPPPLIPTLTVQKATVDRKAGDDAPTTLDPSADPPADPPVPETVPVVVDPDSPQQPTVQVEVVPRDKVTEDMKEVTMADIKVTKSETTNEPKVVAKTGVAEDLVAAS